MGNLFIFNAAKHDYFPKIIIMLKLLQKLENATFLKILNDIFKLKFVWGCKSNTNDLM
jgi:hypothetical protein